MIFYWIRVKGVVSNFSVNIWFVVDCCVIFVWIINIDCYFRNNYYKCIIM